MVIMVIVFLTGCWDSSDINKKDITTTVAVDRNEQRFIFVVEIANLVGEQSTDKYSVFKASGTSYAKARHALDIKHPDPVYLGNTGILVFTKPLVEYGIEEYMYRVRNLHEYRKTLKVVTTTEDAEELLGLQKNKDASSGVLIESMLATLTKIGKSVYVSASEVLEWLSSNNDCFVLPNIDINENKDGFILSGYTVVKKSVYDGFIPSKQAKGLIILLNDDASWVISVPFEGHEATVEAKLKSKKIEPKYDDNKVSFDLDLEFDSIVKYLNDDILYSEGRNKQVNSNLEKILYNELKYTIDQAQKNFKCDYLGFNEYFRIKFPDEFRVMDWSKEFVKAEININIKNELDPGGEFDYNAEVFKKPNE